MVRAMTRPGRRCAAGHTLVMVATVAVMAAAGARAAEPSARAGAWAVREAVSVFDAAHGEFKVVSDTTRMLCWSEAYVALEPFLAPAVDLQALSARGVCSSSEVKREGVTASWRLACAMKDGTQMRLRTLGEVVNDRVVSRTDAVVTGPDGKTAHRLLTQRSAQRRGACPPPSSKPAQPL